MHTCDDQSWLICNRMISMLADLHLADLYLADLYLEEKRIVDGK